MKVSKKIKYRKYCSRSKSNCRAKIKSKRMYSWSRSGIYTRSYSMSSSMYYSKAISMSWFYSKTGDSSRRYSK